MNTTHGLTSDKKARKNLFARVEDFSAIVHLESTHTIMDHWCNNCDMEGVINAQRTIVIEFSSKFVPSLSTTIGFKWATLGILFLLLSIFVELFEGRLDILYWEVILLRKIMQGLILLHQATAFVMLAVPSDFF